MRRIYVSPLWIISACVLLWSPTAHALRLTKDTVRESTFPYPGNYYATWNDSVSLINATNDTLSMEGIHFIVPTGRSAHLEMGYKDAYEISGDLRGLVVKSGIPYRFDRSSEMRILPRETIRITGFRVANCIECPTGGGSDPNAPMDSIRAYVVFETKVSKDTLVIVGDVSATSSGIFFESSPFLSPRMEKGRGARPQRFFNGLGRLEPQNGPAFDASVKAKFRRQDN